MEMLLKLNRHPSANSCISKNTTRLRTGCGSGLETVSLAEALDVALCYGWIDSRADSFDDQHWLLRFTPRRSRSKWSKINRVKVSKLIQEGRMNSDGLREVERAKAEGRWEE
jgi:uncharacterized protein YdeI (YjbR/CyaY-like superfamily)